jgi:hypothetical protein
MEVALARQPTVPLLSRHDGLGHALSRPTKKGGSRPATAHKLRFGSFAYSSLRFDPGLDLVLERSDPRWSAVSIAAEHDPSREESGLLEAPDVHGRITHKLAHLFLAEQS